MQLLSGSYIILKIWIQLLICFHRQDYHWLNWIHHCAGAYGNAFDYSILARVLEVWC